MKKILLLLILVFYFQIYAQEWTFVEDFAYGKMPHGVVVTPDEKIWIGYYTDTDTFITPTDTIPYCPIWIYNPDGSLDRKIQFLTHNTITDTLFDSCRGLSLDINGNVLFSHWNDLWRINYQTYEAMNKLDPYNGDIITEAACDNNGYIYIHRVIGDGTEFKIFDSDFNYYGFVTNYSSTYSRSLVSSPEGKHVYLGRIKSDQPKGIEDFYSPTGPGGTYTVLDTIHQEIAAGHCMDWDRNGLLWIGSFHDGLPGEKKGWYALDPQSNWQIVDSVGQYVPMVMNVPPSGSNFNAPRGAAWSLDGRTMYTADFEGNVIKKWYNDEPIQPLHTSTIYSTADNGPGTLRDAFLDLQTGDTIRFNTSVFPASNPNTISLTSGPLPDIYVGNITIDASNAGVILDGSALSSGYGFYIASDSNRIMGMQIVNFPSDGILIQDGSRYNIIGGNTEGQRNIISGNGGKGINILEAGTSYNTVIGNYIGVDASGLNAFANAQSGIQISNQASYNTIGGKLPGERNIISGNQWVGVNIGQTGTENNIIIGNYIGLDKNGTSSIPNAVSGISFYSGTSHNTVGGDEPVERNIISGNGGDGIWIGENGTSHNKVSGNFIGLNAAGNDTIPNLNCGIMITDMAKNNTIGGNLTNERNIISGNYKYGIQIRDTGTDSNYVKSNFIGTDFSGSISLGNLLNGIYISYGASNVIGGNSPAERNVISGNAGDGIGIFESGTNYNQIIGNYIGTDSSATSALPNVGTGIRIGNEAQFNHIGGGPGSEKRNIISGNNEHGIQMHSSNNYIYNNFIGTDITGSTALPNMVNGIELFQSSHNYIGTNDPSLRNIISGNGHAGLFMFSSDSNYVKNNYFGTDISGTIVIANGWTGITIGEGSEYNIVGGELDSDANLISGNQNEGILIENTKYNLIKGNLIGTNFDGTSALPNTNNGIFINHSCTYNTIGSTNSTERNIISGNGWNGVDCSGPNNTFIGNYVGTDINGNNAIPNTNNGISFYSCSNNVIGGNGLEYGNLLSGNMACGLWILRSDSTVVSGNLIGTNATGTTPLPNNMHGIVITDSSSYTIIGGSTSNKRNIISGNTINGIEISAIESNYNNIMGNFIGTDISGINSLGNGTNGIIIFGGCKHNVIGGNISSMHNIISANTNNGINILGENTEYNYVIGNYIGTDTTGSMSLSNEINGVRISSGASNNQVGGSTADSANIIAFNLFDGVEIAYDNSYNNRILGNSIFNNDSLAIDIRSGANKNIKTPWELSFNRVELSGVAAPGALIQICADITDQGKIFIDTTRANASGIFSKNLLNEDIPDHFNLTVTQDSAHNTSEFSAPVSIPPRAPQNLQAVAGEGLINLSWNRNNETDLAGYKIYRDTSSPAQTFLMNVSGADSTYSDSNFPTFTTYYYRITAIDSAGNESIFSNEVDEKPAAADIATDPSAIMNFGNVHVNSDSVLQLIIANLGDWILNIDSIRIAGPGASQFSILNGDSAFSIPTGNQDELDIRFSPDSSGKKNAILSIYNNDPFDNPYDIDLSGTGVKPEISVSNTMLDFGAVVINSDSLIELVVTNTGGLRLKIDSVKISGPDSHLFTNLSPSDTFSIAPGAQPDTIKVQYSPVSLDTNYAILHIYNNDFFNNPVDINLSGHGVAPDIWVFPTSLNFGKVLVTEDSVLTLSVRNNGTSRLKIDSSKIIGSDINQFLFAGGQGSFFLDPDDTPHTISIQFIPANAGIKNATLRIYCNDQDEQTVDIPLQGEGTIADIAVDKSILNFGSVYVNHDSVLFIIVSNIGSGLLKIDSTRISGTNFDEFLLFSGHDAFQIEPGDNDTVYIQFSPESVAAKSAILEFYSNDPDGDENPKIVVLQGNGLFPDFPDISVQPDSLDYGNIIINEDSVLSLSITNIGGLDLELISLNTTGSDSSLFTILNEQNNIIIEPDSTHSASVQFSPLTTGLKRAFLKIISDDPGQDTLLVKLRGNGVLANMPIINSDHQQLDFDSVWVSLDSTIQVNILNQGTGELVVDSTVIDNNETSEFHFVSGDGAFSIQPGGNPHPVSIALTPASMGIKNATFKLFSNDTAHSPYEIPMNGMGIRSVIYTEPSSIDFGTATIGIDSIDRSLTVKNNGNVNLNVLSSEISGLNAPHYKIVSGSGSFSVPYGSAGQNIILRFSPLSEGPKPVTLKIYHNDIENNPFEVDLNGNGIPQNTPDITIQIDTLDFDSVAVTLDSISAFDVYNQGSGDLRVDSCRLNGQNAHQFEIISGVNGFELPPGMTPQPIDIKFAPSATGHKTAFIRIFSNDPDENPYDFWLHGFGFVPDTVGPDMNLSFTDSANLNTNITISAQVLDSAGVKDVELNYKISGAPDYTKMDMSHQDTDLFSAVIPAPYVTETGIEFYIAASDSLNNIMIGDLMYIRTIISAGIINPVPQPTGGELTSYRIFSVPLNPDDTSPDAFLAANPQLGNYDQVNYRWYEVINGQLKEYPEITAVSPGRGYLFITKLQNLKLNTGEGKSVISTVPFSIPLPKGWSLIGNPFYFDIPYDSLSVSAGNFELREFKGDSSWQPNTTGLEPWQGYAIWMGQAGNFIIKPGISGLSKPVAYFSTDMNDETDWAIQIRAHSNRTADYFNYIGQHRNAQDGIDILDLHEAPRIAQQLSLICKGFQDTDELMTTDIRAVSDEGHIWNIICRTDPQCNYFVLDFDGLEKLPVSFDAFLIEPISYNAYNLLNNNILKFLSKGISEKEFILVAGKKEYLESLKLDVDLYPNSFQLRQNFPNPFNAITQIIYTVPKKTFVEIELYNVLGQNVKTILKEKKSAGTYNLFMDAHDLAAGVYIYKMQADSWKAYKKMLLVK